MDKINEIIELLIDKGLLIDNNLGVKRLKSGTTEGVLYTILYNHIPTYVIKMDHPKVITATEDFLSAYKNIRLLPNLLYTDDQKTFIIYSYISGETHYSRGFKLEWMKILIKELFNHYKKVDKDVSWGRINGIHRNSWIEFNQSSFKSAQKNIGEYIPNEDHEKVELLLNKLISNYNSEEKYYLHGDTGVHNFVYSNNELKGVIDPSPLIGPVVYDFTYAFCSSPDHLDLETLLTSFNLWNKKPGFTEEQIIDEVVFQLYTRIGVCINVHPHDLNGYLDAWKRWREYLPN
jgi:hypothetical protein